MYLMKGEWSLGEPNCVPVGMSLYRRLQTFSRSCEMNERCARRNLQHYMIDIRRSYCSIRAKRPCDGHRRLQSSKAHQPRWVLMPSMCNRNISLLGNGEELGNNNNRADRRRQLQAWVSPSWSALQGGCLAGTRMLDVCSPGSHKV